MSDAPAAPVPASFDFAGRFAAAPICFYYERDPQGPRLLAGWPRLVAAFAGAMGEGAGFSGNWADQSFASNWLASRAYDDWRWSRGSPRVPVYLEVPSGAGLVAITVPSVNVEANGFRALSLDYRSQGLFP